MNSSRPARAARDVDLLYRQTARESQFPSEFASRTLLTNHLPVLSSGKSYQLSSKEAAGNDTGEPQAKMAAPLMLAHRVHNARLAFGLGVRALGSQKENQCQES